MSNFSFLQSQWPQIFAQAQRAEKYALTEPQASAMYSRTALEKSVRWLYDNDSDLKLPYETKLASLMYETCFREIIRPSVYREIHLVRKIGNNAAHGKAVSQEASLTALKHLYRFLQFIGLSYAEPAVNIPPFNEALISNGQEQVRTRREMQMLIEQLEEANAAARLAQAQLKAEAERRGELQQEIDAQKQAGMRRREQRDKQLDLTAANPPLVSEAQTRAMYIDVSLKEAGWDTLRPGIELEYEVTGMPASTNPSGKGYVDYVLWGKDGKPLAVIEAKKTMKDARAGRNQAALYADCLERMHGQRPVIFYTNGFDTHLWDDTFYTDREVAGYYTQDELQLMLDRRESRQDIRTFDINRDIAGRPYQMEAIRRVAENLVVTATTGRLRGKNRASLLVMPTGSGKTRTAAAIVDMLSKSGWVKRVLFLADRKALVKQAKNAFNEHLPELSAIDLTKEKEDTNTRLVFSTYPTIINQIDSAKTDDQRMYGVGHFDLIIIDEAHRSVYQKYRAIFEYFDALLLGLTATPKSDIDRNTYSLFDIEDHQPTFGYELTAAVQEGYLVPHKSISVPVKLPRDGVRYADLPEEEKEHYEEKFGDPTTEEVPDAIDGQAFNSWLFNANTVDEVLTYVMQEGIKVEGGDKLGKTIIFAKNQKHAEFIEERFNKHYPEHGSHFIKIISHKESKSQYLLEKFCDDINLQDPQIAVSVDMMDTGVDAPPVVNLVFFKIVRSASKFWQMIGRGTRLRPNLFGPGAHKSEFLIFDFCQNFEFFDARPEGYVNRQAKPVNQQIFEAKLRVTQLVVNLDAPTDAEKEIRTRYLNELHQAIATLDTNRFVVKKQLRHVEQYGKAEAWQHLTRSNLQEIKTHLAHLPPVKKGDDELARRFDLLVLNGQIKLLMGADASNMMQRISETASRLERKSNIPQVGEHLDLIKEVQQEAFWQTVDIQQMETIRQAFRHLVKYIDKEKQDTVYTNFEDTLEIDDIVIRDHETPSPYVNLQSYKQRVENYIREHTQHIAIYKLCHNKPLTATDIDELEKIFFSEDVANSREEFVKEYGDRPLGAFIRSITGVEQSVLHEAFAEFLQVGTVTADQIRFIKTLITYISKNGVIDPGRLFSSPFTDVHDQGLTGVFKDQEEVSKIVGIIEGINRNASVG